MLPSLRTSILWFRTSSGPAILAMSPSSGSPRMLPKAEFYRLFPAYVEEVRGRCRSVMGWC